jgi:ribonuclease-3
MERLRELFDGLPEPLRRQALTHASWVEDRSQSYERLAFLGDSVLNIAVSRALFPRFDRSSAGRLTKIRAQAVSRRSCAEVAQALGVHDRVLAAAPTGYAHQAGRLVESESVLAEAVEAGIGACFLEFGFEQTAAAVAEAFEPQIEDAIGNMSDFKSELQERLAQRGEFVAYRVVSEEGPPHERRFETVAEVDGTLVGRGTGRSKKESEQEAAREALERMQGDGGAE